MIRTFFLSGLLVICGCDWNASPCHGLRKGDTLRVSIVGALESGSGRFIPPASAPPKACRDDIGLPFGQEFDVTVQRFTGNHGCFSGIAEQFSVGAWTYTVDPELRGVPGGEALAGLYQMKRGTCQGDMWLSLRTEKLPSEPPVAGQPAHSTLEFQFNPSGASVGAPACPQFCAENVAVLAQKL
jgi:hypothetical protein